MRSLPIIAAAVAVLLIILWVFTGFSGAEGQVEKRQALLIKKVGDRSWGKVGKIMADDYSDRWGQDREQALSNLREVGRRFLVLSVDLREGSKVKLEPAVDATGLTASASYVVTGSGPGASMVMTEIDRLKSDFVFHWKKRGITQWGWELVSIDHPDLRVPSYLQEAREFVE